MYIYFLHYIDVLFLTGLNVCMLIEMHAWCMVQCLLSKQITLIVSLRLLYLDCDKYCVTLSLTSCVFSCPLILILS